MECSEICLALTWPTLLWGEPLVVGFSGSTRRSFSQAWNHKGACVVTGNQFLWVLYPRPPSPEPTPSRKCSKLAFEVGYSHKIFIDDLRASSKLKNVRLAADSIPRRFVGIPRISGCQKQAVYRSHAFGRAWLTTHFEISPVRYIGLNSPGFSMLRWC